MHDLLLSNMDVTYLDSIAIKQEVNKSSYEHNSPVEANIETEDLWSTGEDPKGRSTSAGGGSSTICSAVSNSRTWTSGSFMSLASVVGLGQSTNQECSERAASSPCLSEGEGFPPPSVSLLVGELFAYETMGPMASSAVSAGHCCEDRHVNAGIEKSENAADMEVEPGHDFSSRLVSVKFPLPLRFQN